jgi:hypothetical protein
VDLALALEDLGDRLELQVRLRRDRAAPFPRRRAVLLLARA